MHKTEPWVVRRAGLLVAGLAAVVYLASASPYPVPGESANLLAAHADLMPLRPLTQPVWGVVVRLLGAIPVVPLGLALNLFGALCAAAGVGLFYFALRHIGIHPDFYEVSDRISAVAALAGSLCLLTAMPVWMSGSRASAESLDLLLFAGSLYFMVRHIQGQRLWALGVFAFLYGLGMLDSPALFAAAPLVAVLALAVLWGRSQVHWHQLGTVALGGVAAVAFSGLSAWLYAWSPFFGYRGFTSVWRLWKATGRETWEQSLGMGDGTGWLILGLGLLLPLAWSVTCMLISPKNRKRGGDFVIHTAFTVAGPVLLLNIPISPWVLPQTSGFPLLPAVMLATGIGLAAGFWVYVLRRFLAAGSWEGSWVKAETLVIAAVLLCLLPAAGLTFLRVRPQNAELFHWAVTNMLDALPPRQWLLTNGSLDPLLVIEARDRGQPLTTINIELFNNRRYRMHMADHTPDMNLRILANHSPRGMLHAWLQRGAPTTRELASSENGLPWAQKNQIAVPDRGIYSGAAPRQTDFSKLFGQQMVFWKGTVERLERLGGRGTAAAREERGQLAQRFSRDATAHGCLLDQNGRSAEAEAAYVMARRLCPENVVAHLNLYNLRKPAAATAEDEKERKELRRLLLPTREPETALSLVRKWGPFRERRVYDSYLAAFGVAAKPVDGKIDVELANIIEVRRTGRLDEAFALCRELVKTQGSPEAWCLLGCLAYEKGDMPLLLKCLDRTGWKLNKTAAGAQLHLLAGLRALTIKDLKLARYHIEEVLKAKPDDLLALEYLVGIYWPTGVTEELWENLDRLLALDPGSFSGNAVMGYIFAQQKQYDFAERAFVTALQRRPNAGLLNNLAWVLHLDGKNEEALKCAKDSVTMDPSSGMAWNTYACILQNAQQTAAAGEAFAKAIAITPDDVTIQLDYLSFLCASQRWDDAATRLASLRSRHPDISDTQRETLLALQARVKDGTAGNAKDTRH